MKLGTHIAALRKLKGITQEQLATAVGVSAPAVSKWETDTSCPDISLLCPLARALGTNVDKLLQFEEVLSKDELTNKINEIVEIARSGKLEIAESMLNNLLHTYPSDCELKYNTYLAVNLLAMLFPMETPERKQARIDQTKQLLNEIRLDGASSNREKAVSALAMIAIQDDNLEQAEQLLKELPEHTNDTSMIWAHLYLKKNEHEKALEVTQRRLFVLVGLLQRCLVSMMNKEMIPCAEQTLEICKVYRQVEEIFNLSSNTSEGLFMEAYLRMGNQEEAMKSAIKMMNDIVGTVQNPNPLLFFPTFNIKEGQQAVTKEMKEMLLEGVLKEEALVHYQQDEEFQNAIKKLQMDIQNCK